MAQPLALEQLGTQAPCGLCPPWATHDRKPLLAMTHGTIQTIALHQHSVHTAGLTSIEDVRLIVPPHHRLLSAAFVNLHQACPGRVVASLAAYPELVEVCV